MKKYKWLLLIFLIFFVIRLCLPYVILHYVVNRINKIPEYKVHIDDSAVSLYKGEYSLEGIQLNKISQKISKPFFTAKTVKFSIQGKKLLQGLIVGQIYINQPVLNLVSDDAQGGQEQLSIDKQWQQAVQALFPLHFNKIVVSNGEVHFQSFNTKPSFDLFLKKFNAEINNLQDIELHKKKALSSDFKAEAITIGNATVKMNMQCDSFAKQPTFDLDLQLENMNIQEINNFLQHYTKIKVKKGILNLYLEVVAAKGRIKGYIKPIFKNLAIIDPKSHNPIEVVYKGAVKLLTKLLENDQTKTIATKIEINGLIKDPNASTWSTITNLLHHAFLQALLPQIDHSIDMANVKGDLKN